MARRATKPAAAPAQEDAPAHGTPHSIWRGQLRLALVACPVALYPAHRDTAALHFHLINPETGNRVRMVTEDAETGAELSRRDLVRGFEFERDRYLLLDDADFESARIDSSETITIDKFVPEDSIGPLYFENAYYLAPDGTAGADIYAVLRAAIAASGRVALARVVIARRERAVAIVPMAQGLALHTLREARELTDPAPLFAGVPTATPDAALVKLARQLVDRQQGRFSPDDTEDRYAARLREVIAAKLKGEQLTPPEPIAQGNVIDLMAALKRSLAQDAPQPSPKRVSAAGKGTSPRGKTATREKAAPQGKAPRRRRG